MSLKMVMKIYMYKITIKNGTWGFFLCSTESKFRNTHLEVQTLSQF